MKKSTYCMLGIMAVVGATLFVVSMAVLGNAFNVVLPSWSDTAAIWISAIGGMMFLVAVIVALEFFEDPRELNISSFKNKNISYREHMKCRCPHCNRWH